MKRFLIASLIAAASLGGCKCGNKAEQPAAPAAQAPSSAPEKIAKIGGGDVQKYVGVQKEGIEAYRVALEDWKSSAGPAKPGETAMARFQGNVEIQKKLLVAMTELQEKVGLDGEVARAVEALYQEISRLRAVYDKAGGDAALEDAERKLQAIEPEQRAESELAKAAANLRSLKDAADTRARYGSEAVTAMLDRYRDLDEIVQIKANLAEELIGK